MNDVIAKTDSDARPGAAARDDEYTGILPSQKIREMLADDGIVDLYPTRAHV